jgi:hypothetical protein
VESNGAVTLLHTRIEGDELVAEFINVETAEQSALKARVEGNESAAETRGSALTIVPAAVASTTPTRVVISGSAFLPVGKTGLYQIISFGDKDPQGLELEWHVYGPASIDYSPGRHLWIKGEKPGRVDITVDARHPSGWSAFGSFSVSVQTLDPSEGDIRVYFLSSSEIPSKLGEPLILTVSAFHRAPESTSWLQWKWNFGDGNSGDSMEHNPGEDTSLHLSPHTYTKAGTYPVSVEVEDQQGRSDQAKLTVIVEEPTKLRVLKIEGEKKIDLTTDKMKQTYTAIISGGVPPYVYTWALNSGEKVLASKDPNKQSIDVEFTRVGFYLLQVRVADNGQNIPFQEASYAVGVTVEGGTPLKADLNLSKDAQGNQIVSGTVSPKQVEVNEPVSGTLNIEGGVNIVSGREGSYEGEVNWEDGNIDTVKDTAQRDSDEATVNIAHTYSKEGTYTVKAKVWDSSSKFVTTEEKITVTPANNPPVADDQTVTTEEDTSVDITLTGNDPDGDTLTYTVVDQPSHGTLSGTAPDLTYTPDDGYLGSDSFTFKVNDGQEDSAEARVRITVERGPEEFVVWYTENVTCWNAPYLFVTNGDGFETSSRRCNFSGGGLCGTKSGDEEVVKVKMEGGFSTFDDAKSWICSQFTARHYHRWCGYGDPGHLIIDGLPHYMPGNTWCDWSKIPEVPNPSPGK